MTRQTDSPTQVPGTGHHREILFVVWSAATLVISGASPGATRMYAWPWWIAYALSLVCPVAVLVSRTLDRREPLRLPDFPWLAVVGAGVAITLFSALMSPFRGPSLLWSAPLFSAAAAILVLHDWLYSTENPEFRREKLLRVGGAVLALTGAVGLLFWLSQALSQQTLRDALNLRNAEPLGHASYTAGLALLLLPCAGILAVRIPGRERIAWILAALVALALLVTSASRGGLIGFAVLAACSAPAIVRSLRIRWWAVALAATAVAAGLFSWNPRLRDMLKGSPPGAQPNISNVQRAAMLKAGWLMGLDRPLIGWGPGTTPLAYPRFRAQLDGGTENVLQLHSTPVALWAEYGAAGVFGTLALAGLAMLSQRRAVLLGLSGYAVFSLTDWQMDVPVFAFAVAAALALLAQSANHEQIQTLEPRRARSFAKNNPQGNESDPHLGGPSRPSRFPENGSWSMMNRKVAVLFAVTVVLVCIAVWGRADPTPELSTRAVMAGRDAFKVPDAIATLRESLALNPYQEIAHFNLGWLLVVRDPAAAERHFLAAAQLVPDKGGVYFGLGLARLNQDHNDAAARAFAMEALNDPLFLVSPWWRTEPFATLRRTHRDEFIQLAATAAGRYSGRDDWTAREARYNAALTSWILGSGDTTEMLRRSLSPERVNFFSDRPSLPAFDSAAINVYRRERTGYPVLMRQPDLGIPTDLFDVQENALATRDLRFLFPAKGWLPAPLLLELLHSN